MIEACLIDEFIIYTAPILMGSHAYSMATQALKKMQVKIQLKINDIR